jgi:putative hydrolase of the HAD superfamily
MYRDGQGGTAYQAICAELGLPPEEATALLRHHRAHLPRLRLTRSAAEALRQMKGTWRVGILTNGMPELQRIKVAALGLDARVDAVVYADEWVAGGKPALDVFARICDDLGVPSARCVMVGDDGVADVQGGRAAGMRTIWLQRPNRSSPPQGTADATVQSLAEVPAIAARLIGD